MSTEIKDMKTEELTKKLHEEEIKVRNFDMQFTGNSKNVKEKRNAKKEIARIMTELTKRARA